MTHEDGIEKAADEFDACWKQSKLIGIADIDAAERIIGAYLSASGMVIVPREPTDDMVHEAAYARPEIRTADFPIVYEVMIGAAPNQLRSKP